MSDIFIAHVEEDARTALEIAIGLEETGYSTWCYEIDSIPGPSYLIQTGKAIEESKAIVVVISPHSVASRQVTREIIRAHESGKEFIPILLGITHSEFQSRQPEWREVLAAAASKSIPPEGVAPILPGIINGLRTLGIAPNLKPDTAKIRQIRSVLDELREQSVPEKPEDLKLPAVKPEPESVTTQIPSTRPHEKTVGRRRWTKLAVIASSIVVVAVIAVWLVISLGRPDDTATHPTTPEPAPTVTAPPTVTTPPTETEPETESVTEPVTPPPETATESESESESEPTTAQDLAEYIELSYDPVSFDKSEIHGSEVFYATITGIVTCTKDLPVSNIEFSLTSQVIAEHTTSGTTVTLNPGYTIIIESFPAIEDETVVINKTVPLQFPTRAETGDYIIIVKVIEAKANIGVWLDVSSYLAQDQDLGIVKYITPDSVTSPLQYNYFSGYVREPGTNSPITSVRIELALPAVPNCTYCKVPCLLVNALVPSHFLLGNIFP